MEEEPYPSASDRARLPGRLSCVDTAKVRQVIGKRLLNTLELSILPCPGLTSQKNPLTSIHKLLGKLMRAVAIAIVFQNRQRKVSFCL